MTCERYRELILPYLYDAVEPAEREQLEAHLHHCAGCTEALNGVRVQVGLLAEAVKPVHAEIEFKPPTPATPASTVAMPPKTRPAFTLLNRWLIAASLLIVVFGIGGLIGAAIWREESVSLESASARLAKAQSDLQKGQQDLNRNREKTLNEIRSIQKEIDEVFNQWRTEETKTRTILEKERVQIIVNGPRTALAGALNQYNVELRGGPPSAQDPANKLLPGTQKPAAGESLAQVNARVVNQQTQEILYEKQLKLGANNQARFDLPTELPIKPNDDLTLEFETRDAGGKPVRLRDHLKLVFPEYLTHLTCDRPIYRPGETLRFRSLTLERFSLKPADQDFHLRFRIQNAAGKEFFAKEVTSQVIQDGDQKPITGPNGLPLRGLGVGEWTLPADLPDGAYTLSVAEVNDLFNEEKRGFHVRRAQASRFNKEAQFHRSAYGPGDQVKLTVRATPLRGNGAPNPNMVQITAVALIDGQRFETQSRRDFNAKDALVEFAFTLPDRLHKGVGAVTIRCDDGAGNHESFVRDVPIIPRDLNVDFYPEGGDLIAGVPNRVYFQARTTANKPADFEGVLLDGNQEIARLHTLTDDREPGINQGLGSFTFTPQAGRVYRVRIDSPIGIDRVPVLPLAKESGVVLHTPHGVFDAEIPITIRSTQSPRELLVGAYCRGRMLDRAVVKAPAHDSVSVRLKPAADAGGVYRITVYEKVPRPDGVTYRPLAERLVFRRTKSNVAVSVTADRDSYGPGDAVKLKLQATNEKKEPVPAVALVTVVDGRLRRLLDDRTERSMPAHFLLGTEIRNPEDLENSDVLLGNHPRAAEALDLLLGTQGWRRFAEQQPGQVAQFNPQKQQAGFVANAAALPQVLGVEQKKIDEVDQAFVARAIELNKKLAEKERDDVGPQELDHNVRVLQSELQASQMAIEDIHHRLRFLRSFMVQYALGGIVLTLLFVGFFLVSIGLRRLAEGGTPRPWFVLGFALLGLLFFLSVLGTFMLMSEPFLDDFRFRDHRFNGLAKMGLAPNPPIALALEKEREPFDVPWLMEDAPEEVGAGMPGVPALAAPMGRGGPMDQAGLFLGRAEAFHGEIWNNQFGAAARDGVAVDIEQKLRQQGDFQRIVQRRLNRRVALPPPADPCVVRVYAHRHLPGADEMRRDFAETVYWHPVLVLPNGSAEVIFELSDLITQYEITVMSHTPDGRLGFHRTELSAKRPYTVDLRVPVEVSETDQFSIPVTLTNETSRGLAGVLSVRAKGLTLEGKAEIPLKLKPMESGREWLRLKPAISEGEVGIRVQSAIPTRGDGVERTFKIARGGFPVTHSVSGVTTNGIVEHTLSLPEQWTPGSLTVQAVLFPSPLAELQGGLEGLMREPAACFEQASALQFPNILTLAYLKETRQPNPMLERRARKLLAAGSQKLHAFECTDPKDGGLKKGFEWFGGDAPPHEALTAYGLLHLRDLMKVHRVDPEIVSRTEKYLLDARNGLGGFKLNPRPFDQANDATMNAYIVWALTESGVSENLDVELTALQEQARDRKDPYFLVLAALAHLNRKRHIEGTEMLRQISRFQKAEGNVSGAVTSITGSQGRDLDIETTSLAILGWLKADRPGEFNGNLQNAAKWLGQQRRGPGTFGNSQATILALKAMVAHAQKFPRHLQMGDATLTHRSATFVGDPDGKLFFPDGPERLDGFDRQGTNRASFTNRSHEPIVLTLRDGPNFKPGKNVVQLAVGNNAMPYTLTWSYRTLKPANDAETPITISTKLAADSVKEGETVKLHAILENRSTSGQGMTIAVVGLPGGLTIPEDAKQLNELTRAGGGDESNRPSAWELRGRDLVLYWRQLGPKSKVEFRLDLIARLPGAFHGPPSRVYAVYDSDRKFWCDPLAIRIAEGN